MFCWIIWVPHNVDPMGITLLKKFLLGPLFIKFQFFTMNKTKDAYQDRVRIIGLTLPVIVVFILKSLIGSEPATQRCS